MSKSPVISRTATWKGQKALKGGELVPEEWTQAYANKVAAEFRRRNGCPVCKNPKGHRTTKAALKCWKLPPD